MVRHPGDYRWSSYSTNAEGRESRLLQPHEAYLGLGARDDKRRAAYRALIAAELEPIDVAEIRSAVNGGFVLGNPQFRAEIAAMLRRPSEPGVSARPRKSRPHPATAIRTSS
jgi:putative transposase